VFDTYAGTESGVLHVDRDQSLGLTGHRVSAIHALRDRAGDVVIVAGTYGDGLFRSADGGRSWSPVTAGMAAPAARTIGPDPLEPGGLICGTEPARLFRSADSSNRAGLTTRHRAAHVAPHPARGAAADKR